MSLVQVAYSQVVVSATGRCLVLKSPTVCVCVCHGVWSGAAITLHLQWVGKGVRLRKKVKKLLSWFTSTCNFCCDARTILILLIFYTTIQTIKLLLYLLFLSLIVAGMSNHWLIETVPKTRPISMILRLYVFPKAYSSWPDSSMQTWICAANSTRPDNAAAIIMHPLPHLKLR
jgi:hypothetical protein